MIAAVKLKSQIFQRKQVDHGGLEHQADHRQGLVPDHLGPVRVRRALQAAPGHARVAAAPEVPGGEAEGRRVLLVQGLGALPPEAVRQSWF